MENGSGRFVQTICKSYCTLYHKGPNAHKGDIIAFSRLLRKPLEHVVEDLRLNNNIIICSHVPTEPDPLVSGTS